MVIGITGGIGSGKSTICIALEVMGYKIYDCDKRASELMNSSPEIHVQLVELFGEEVYTEQRLINRPFLASKIFGDERLLKMVNAIVHPVVREDIRRFASEHAACDFVFVESAILFESGLEGVVSKSITVSAPLELRLQRVVSRDATDIESVKRRIASQMSDEQRESKADFVIISDDKSSMLMQLEYVIESMS